MMSLSMVNHEFTGTNLEYFTIYVYPKSYCITAEPNNTGISSKIMIERESRNITQLDIDTPIPANPENRITCSAIMGILPILGKHFILAVQLCKQITTIQGHSIYEIQKVIFLSFQEQEKDKDYEGNNEQGIALQEQNQKINYMKYYLKTFLLIEGYYFAFRFDLSLSRSAHAAGTNSKKKFFWNHNISKIFDKLEDSRWFVGIIQGSIRSFKIPVSGITIQYILITRRSWALGGTRFNSRGIDSKGNVANFCQTEQLLFLKNQCFSHVQIRGAVPAFWKQTGLTQAVQLDQDQDKNKLAFVKHFNKLIRNYDKVFNVNLLCLDRKGEDELTYYYQKLVKDTNIKDIRYEYFDVHCVSKGQKFQRCNYLITQKLKGIIRHFDYYSQNTLDKTVTSVQNGVIRVNCLDNLDRTNLIQSKIAYFVLTSMLEQAGIDVREVVGCASVLVASDNIQNTSIFNIHLKNAWADNGDQISEHYTGTGSTHTNITRTGKRNLKGMIDHGYKSCKRLYQQFVDDNQKQQAIDILLCEHTETVNLQQIKDRLKELPTGQGEWIADW